jgi:hypothetical protein
MCDGIEPQYDELDGFVRGIAWAKRGERQSGTAGWREANRERWWLFEKQ